MLKVTVLLPIRDNDGIPLDEELNDCLSSLHELTGGYTTDGSTKGTYTMDDGTIACDTCMKVWVVVEGSRYPELKVWASECCRLLRQESVYFEYHETFIEFVRGGV